MRSALGKYVALVSKMLETCFIIIEIFKGNWRKMRAGPINTEKDADRQITIFMRMDGLIFSHGYS